MSAGITSGCTPCAAAPVVAQPQPATSGGGAPMKDATGGGGDAQVAPEPAPVASQPAAGEPAPGAQPAAPDEVSGGGAGQGGATCYQPAPEPVQCGQWVPAPVVVEGPPPTGAPAPTSGPDTPPDPMAGPAPLPGTTGPAAPATTPASQLPTWPQWQQHFVRLGVQPEEVAKLGAANLTDGQLAKVYEHVHGGIVAAGGVPGQTPLPGSVTGAWNPEWEARFTALGLPQEFVAQIRAEALRTGADAGKLEAVYQQVAEKLRANATQGPQGPQAPQQPAQDQPGWNPQVEQAFRSLGMPDEVLQMYAQSGAPLGGLEVAYKHAAGRLQDFTDRGWMQKFQEAGVPPVQTWSLILGDVAVTDKDAQAALDAHRKGQRSIWQKGGQLATSLFPGGRLVQYAFGKEFVSGDKIDRSAPMEIGMAALSGLAAFAAIRGGKNIMAGISARNGGFTAINGVNDTLAKLGLPKGGVDAMEQAAMGATQTWGFKQKLLSFIPGTKLHREVVGLGHAEAAARAFNGGGAARILANDADSALQMATITRLFDDIKSGATRVQGGGLAYLGPFKSGPLATWSKDGSAINFAKNLRMGGNGNAQLVGLMEVGGNKLGKTPEWLTNAASLIDDVASRSPKERATLGNVMASNLVRDLDSFSGIGWRPGKYVESLRSSIQPSWYTELAAATKAQWPGRTMPPELFNLRVNSAIFGTLSDDLTAALAKLDRSALSPEATRLVDDAVAKFEGVQRGLASSKAAGALDESYGLAVDDFSVAVNKLIDEDSAVARQLFEGVMDESALRMAQVRASDAVRAEWLATLAGGADDAAAVADDVAAVADDVAAAADDVARGVGGAGTGAAATAAAGAGTSAAAGAPVVAAADDAASAARHFTAAGADVDAVRAANMARPANRPVQLRVNRNGEAVTPAGLLVPSWTSAAGAPIPTSVNDPSIAGMAEAMRRIAG